MNILEVIILLSLGFLVLIFIVAIAAKMMGHEPADWWEDYTNLHEPK